MVVTIDVTYAVATMETQNWSNFCPKNKITRVLVYLQVYLNQTKVFFHQLIQNKTNDNTSCVLIFLEYVFCTSLEHQIVLPD